MIMKMNNIYQHIIQSKKMSVHQPVRPTFQGTFSLVILIFNFDLFQEVIKCKLRKLKWLNQITSVKKTF